MCDHDLVDNNMCSFLHTIICKGTQPSPHGATAKHAVSTCNKRVTGVKNKSCKKRSMEMSEYRPNGSMEQFRTNGSEALFNPVGEVFAQCLYVIFICHVNSLH